MTKKKYLTTEQAFETLNTPGLKHIFEGLCLLVNDVLWSKLDPADPTKQHGFIRKPGDNRNGGCPGGISFLRPGVKENAIFELIRLRKENKSLELQIDTDLNAQEKIENLERQKEEQRQVKISYMKRAADLLKENKGLRAKIDLLEGKKLPRAKR